MVKSNQVCARMEIEISYVNQQLQKMSYIVRRN
jgi:hypothetical protein